MVKFNASVSLALLQLALFSRTSVSLPVPSGLLPGEGGPSIPYNPGTSTNVMMGVGGVVVGASAIYCGVTIVKGVARQCLGGHPQGPDLEANRPGPHSPHQGEPTAGPASVHAHGPTENTALLGSHASAKHTQEQRETAGEGNPHGPSVHQRDLM